MAAPSLKENLFHIGSSETRETPRKQNRSRQRTAVPDHASGPLLETALPGEELGRGTASSVGVTISASQSAAAVAEERVLIEKMKAKRHAMAVPPASTMRFCETTPKAAPKVGSTSPLPPPVPQPPTPCQSDAADASICSATSRDPRSCSIAAAVPSLFTIPSDDPGPSQLRKHAATGSTASATFCSDSDQMSSVPANKNDGMAPLSADCTNVPDEMDIASLHPAFEVGTAHDEHTCRRSGHESGAHLSHRASQNEAVQKAAMDDLSLAKSSEPSVASDTRPPSAASTSSAEIGGAVPHAAWRLAEEHKERGNRRYAIKSWGEALKCYHKAIAELKRHPAYSTATAEGRALSTKTASYHANAAAALMQQGKLAEAVCECEAGMKADCNLGKALLRVAHVQLMLGDVETARQYYVKAASAGSKPESDAGLKACADDENLAIKLRAEIVMCRRAGASTVGSSSSSVHLKGLLNSLDVACTRSPHNIVLQCLLVEALSASGRMEEAHNLCEAHLAKPAVHRAHTGFWMSALGRVLYDSSMLSEAARKLADALQQPHIPAGSRVLARVVERLEAERAEGNSAFNRQDWAMAVDLYTRALTVDPTHQAVSDCSTAIALNRSYVKAYLRRGELRLKLGDRNGALEDYHAAERLDAGGAIGLEAKRRMSRMRKHAAEEAATAANASRTNARGWERARHGWERARHTADDAGYSSRSKHRASCTGPSKVCHYYEVLGVEIGATADEIRKAYKKMCLKYHPDKCTGSERDKGIAQGHFLAVQKAHEVLSDPVQKRIYDHTLSRQFGVGSNWPRGVPQTS